MLDALTQFNHRTNRMFGTCVEIQNMAAKLNRTTLEMRLLAANGVVYAAHLPGGEGRPLLALADILTGIPEQIRPAVRLLESLCADLARCTADCSTACVSTTRWCARCSTPTRAARSTSTPSVRA